MNCTPYITKVAIRKSFRLIVTAETTPAIIDNPLGIFLTKAVLY